MVQLTLIVVPRRGLLLRKKKTQRESLHKGRHCLRFLNRSPTHFLQMSYLSKAHGFRRGSSGPTKKESWVQLSFFVGAGDRT